jgi:ABC transport system ATP-binding/permease protein
VLALPDFLVWVCRPFIAAYWGWGGYLASMRETRLYDAVAMNTDTWITPSGIALAVLLLHGAFAALATLHGLERARWA